MRPPHKTYFISDMHLGSAFHQDPLRVERHLVRWLRHIAPGAKALYLVGDLFDYWYEYRYVVPRGHIRFLGALSDLSDQGVQIHIFTGNHDIWMSDYLEQELGAIIHREAWSGTIDGAQFFIAHGDEFDRDNKRYQLLRKIFHSPICQGLYGGIHPRWSGALAHRWSLRSRRRGIQQQGANEYLGEQDEYLVRFAKQHLKEIAPATIHYFIFGHRHILLDLMLSSQSRLLILGDWITHFSYAVWDGETMLLDTYPLPDTQSPTS